MPNPDGSPTFQEILAGGGLQAPPMGPTPPAPPPVVNMPEQTIGPNGLQSSLAPPMRVQAAPSKSGLDSNVDTSAMGNPIGALDIGLLHKSVMGQGPPDLNVDYSQMPQAPHGSVTYQGNAKGGGSEKNAGGTNMYIPAGGGGGGGGRPGDPYKNQMGELEKEKTQNMLLHGLRLDDARMQQEGAAGDVNTIEAMQAEQARQAEAHGKKLDAAKETYQRVLEDAPHESIDADRWWGSRSTGQNVALFLAAGLAGFSAGVSGQGGNAVIDQINRSVDRDIDVQKANIANNKSSHAEKSKAAETVYGMIRQGVQDDQAAAELTKAWTLDRMAAEAKQRATLSQNTAMQADAEAFRAAADMKIAELKDKAAAAMASKGAGFDRKLYIDLKQKYLDKGATNEQADAMTLHDMGIVNAGNPNFAKGGGEGDKKAAATTEAKALIENLRNTDTGKVSAGVGYGNSLWAKAPGFFPGVQGSRQAVADADEHRTKQMAAAGMAWKATTGGVEPKNPHLIEEIVASAAPQPGDDPDTIRKRDNLMIERVRQAAKGQGVDIAELPGASTSLQGALRTYKPAGQ